MLWSDGWQHGQKAYEVGADEGSSRNSNNLAASKMGFPTSSSHFIGYSPMGAARAILTASEDP